MPKNDGFITADFTVKVIEKGAEQLSGVCPYFSFYNLA
jgi:hypothetical protein